MTRFLPLAAGVALALTACTSETSTDVAAQIVNPTATTFTDADPIAFTGTFSPATGEPAVTSLRWTSSLFGELHATQAPEAEGESSFSTRLSAGEHQVGFFVAFDDGQTASDQITLSIAASGRAPTVEILSPQPAQAVQVGEPVALEGLVASSDFPPEQLSATWVIADPEGAELSPPRPTVDADGVVVGTWTPAVRGSHTIVLRVTDPESLVASASVEIDALDLSDIDNDDDGVTADLDCDDDNPDVFPGARDEPDMAFVDQNCDGIDGDIARSVFVDARLGSPDNDGLTAETPVATLADGLALARTTDRPWVLLASGADSAYAIPSIERSVSLAGGYQRTFAQRSETEKTTITGDHPGRGLVVWRVSRPMTLQNLEVASVPPSASASTSSIALHIFEASDVVIDHTTVRAVPALDAPRPAAPDPAAAGDAGDAGSSDTRACISGGDSPSPWGGAGAVSFRAGGKGGEPGTNLISNRWGSSGASGTGGAAGGSGASGATFCATANVGRDGAPGSRGSTGSPSDPLGFFVDNPRFLDDFIFTPNRGTDGTNGTNGDGGGGGGGGSFGQLTCSGSSALRRGGGGGGGGGGGQGGDGGLAAEAGGSSIALVITDSTVRLVGATAIASDGGFGADGAVGGAGGRGGDGGAGGTSTGRFMCGGSNLSNGARGGRGGSGGSGGSGGGGAGGSSIAVWCQGSPSISGLDTADLRVAAVAAEGGRAGGAGSQAPSGLVTEELDCR